MIKTAEGIVDRVIYISSEVSKFFAIINGEESQCINYNYLTGEVKPGDRVLLNVTAIELQLGTGGYHFVIANLSHPEIQHLEKGHIMKLKYTPMQLNCMTAEAQESQYHDIFNSFESLKGLPVIIGSLHSSLAPCCIYLKHRNPSIKLCYIMSDQGALPIYFSDKVSMLKQKNFLDTTITYGNSFGGDYECVNIYTALITAKEVVKADIAIVCMGPGIVGTDTTYGFSGTEQANISDAVNRLEGFPAVIPRISFADKRPRHFGISHHSITVLSKLCCTRTNIAIPKLEDKDLMEYLIKQLTENNINSLHNIFYVDINDVYDVFKNNSYLLDKMGRSYEEDKEYFIGCASSAKLCIDKLP